MTTPEDWSDAKADFDRKNQEREPVRKENTIRARKLVAAYHLDNDITLENGFDADMIVVFDFDGLSRTGAVENIVALQDLIFRETKVSMINLGGGPLYTETEQALLQVSLSVDINQTMNSVWDYLDTPQARKQLDALGVARYTLLNMPSRGVSQLLVMPARADNDNNPKPR